MCIKLAEYGATVAITAINVSAAKTVANSLLERGLRADAYEHDVCREDHANRVVTQIKARLGDIDILVNNAGISQVSNLLDIEKSEWERILATNLYGLFFSCKAALPGMIARKRGALSTSRRLSESKDSRNLGRIALLNS